MKSSFTKAELLEDEWIIQRFKQLEELKLGHQNAIKSIDIEMRVLTDRKMELTGFGKDEW